ncbi:hypothetical protein KKI23_01530 [Patescibacteria group bacterium]|nr:hypothetical protein [Patescibacteria group bacterium]
MANSAQKKNNKAPIWIPIIVILSLALITWRIMGISTDPDIQESNNPSAANSSTLTNSADKTGGSNFSIGGNALAEPGYIPDTSITIQELPQELQV